MPVWALMIFYCFFILLEYIFMIFKDLLIKPEYIFTDEEKKKTIFTKIYECL